LMVVSGQVLVQHGSPSEDANLAFTPVAGNVYFGIDFSVVDPGGPIPGTDNEYFAHFKDSGFGFVARLDIVPPSSGGDFSVGIATVNSTSDAIWPTDFSYGVTYRAIVRYDQDENIAELWINAASEGDTSIIGADEANPGDVIESFALRQSDSDLNEGILVDNLNIGTSFGAVLSTNDIHIDGFGIYPNPTSLGYVNLKSRNGNYFDVSVFDVLGKQVLNSKVTDGKLNVSSLNTGLYIMKVTQEEATVTKKLVIK
ncbi:MAG TPA: T9SS type A sorting domain-containing protein, partial [Flavobacteriaceae bacterium]|nr:T9SS type A sorting domain-containing protein [Flavobacteriaceae bacterium]